MAVLPATDSEFPLLLQEHQNVIVKYYADWCGSCKLFAPKYRRLSENDLYSNVTFLDVDAENNPDARSLANADNLPFFAIFKNGSLVDGSATAKEETVVKMLEKVQQ